MELWFFCQNMIAFPLLFFPPLVIKCRDFSLLQMPLNPESAVNTGQSTGADWINCKRKALSHSLVPGFKSSARTSSQTHREEGRAGKQQQKKKIKILIDDANTRCTLPKQILFHRKTWQICLRWRDQGPLKVSKMNSWRWWTVCLCCAEKKMKKNSSASLFACHYLVSVWLIVL